MIVNLDHATCIVVAGSKIQLHFQDSSVHMRGFRSRKELSSILDSWKDETLTLRSWQAAPRAAYKKTAS
jgi:hypothetical protein